jgi:SAM-dependent methyltransferase
LTLKRVHRPDPEFKTASPFLRKVLLRHCKKPGSRCVDLPCGNGRNTFLLTRHFSHVHGIDINAAYLAAILQGSEYYGIPSISLEQRDLLSGQPVEAGSFNWICNIHFYRPELTKRCLGSMAYGSYLLLETPDCRGENFRDLPTEAEIRVLIGENEILEYEFKVCKNKNNVNGKGSARLLIKKT